jgi:hypothetical protein
MTLSSGVSSTAVIPLVVLSVLLVFGGIALIILTRKIARVRLLRELQLAAEAKRVEESLGEKPVLVDFHVEPYRIRPFESELSWTALQVRLRPWAYDTPDI